MAQESLNNEIKWLEDKLQAKKSELGTGTEQNEEKETVKDIFKEAQALLPQPTSQSSSALDDTAMKIAHELEEKEHGEIVESLVGEALAKGLPHAMKTAAAMRNPHILDDFHDALADQYYQKLQESRKLK